MNGIDTRASLDRSIVRSLQDMLHLDKRYVQSFNTDVGSVPPDVPDYNVVIHANKIPTGEHRGRYNTPFQVK
jgi:hypothetical protein